MLTGLSGCLEMLHSDAGVYTNVHDGNIIRCKALTFIASLSHIAENKLVSYDQK